MAFVLRSVHISAFVFILGYNCLAFWGFLTVNIPFYISFYFYCLSFFFTLIPQHYYKIFFLST